MRSTGDVSAPDTVIGIGDAGERNALAAFPDETGAGVGIDGRTDRSP